MGLPTDSTIYGLKRAGRMAAALRLEASGNGAEQRGQRRMAARIFDAVNDEIVKLGGDPLSDALIEGVESFGEDQIDEGLQA